MKEIKISEIEGIRIGHTEDSVGCTGCTAIICEKGATPGVDVRGGGPASREIEHMKQTNVVDFVNCVMLCGGSAYGLAAADGAMKYLEEHGVGFKSDHGYVPIVSAACLYDLSIGDSKCRPDLEMGYQACKNSEKNDPKEGHAGAGMGATVGKLRGDNYKMKSGQGIYAAQQGNVKVGVIAIVNAMGNIVDPETGKTIAGMLNEDWTEIISTTKAMMEMVEVEHDVYNVNTTLGCIITNANLTKGQCCKLAGIAHNAFAKTIHPVHTSADGDTIFVLSTNEVDVYPDALGVMATEVMEKAILRAVLSAEPAFGLKCAKDFYNY